VPRDLHSFPTRRSSDLSADPAGSASTAACASGGSAGTWCWPVTSASYASRPEIEMVDVVSEEPSAGAPPRSGAPQLEQNLLASRSEEHTSELQSRENLV